MPDTASDNRVTIRLPYTVRHRLTALAAEQQTSVSGLLRRAAEQLADGAEPVSLQAPLNERELATIRRLDAQVVAAVERYTRPRRRYLYARLRSTLRTRELQASLEPEL